MFETRAAGVELLDDFNCDELVAVESYRLMERVNRFLGGTGVVKRFVKEERAGLLERRPLRVLDIGSGGCDIPLAVSRWAAARGIDVEFTCVEYNRHGADLTRRKLADAADPKITFIEEDILSHQPNEPYDCAVASSFFHHYADEVILESVSRLRTFVRRSLLINDLLRSWTTYVGCWLVAIGFPAGVWHDALLSVRRGFRPKELETLLRRLGNVSCSAAQAPFCRVKAAVHFNPR